MKKMREIRFFKNVTLDEIYVLTGRKISQPKLSRIERGIEIPNDNERQLIAKALREPVNKVFPSEECE